MKLSTNITNLRKSYNLSEEDLAKRLSVNKEDIINWENNKSEPSIKELKLLSKEFNISIDELVDNNKYVSEDRKVFHVGYEYKSKKTIKGKPFIHINIGRGKKARGFIAIGNDAKGVVAIGGIAIGILTLGGVSIGYYSVGGYSIGKYVSIGGYANGHIAVGKHVNGTIILAKPTSNELRNVILDNYPNTWRFVLDFICGFLR